MHRQRLLAVLCAAGACADAPTAQELRELEGGDRLVLNQHAIPSGVEAAPPAPALEQAPFEPTDERASGQPRLRVGPMGAFDDDTALETDSTSANCPFIVETQGFPALRSDNAFTVAVSRYVLSASEGEDEIMAVHWEGIDSTTRERTIVYDGDETLGFEGTFEESCRKLRHQAIKHANVINARLRTFSWRPLRELDVTVSAPFSFDDDGSGDAELAPAQTRPVEFLWQHGEAIFRIPRVRVLARLPTESWSHRRDGSGDWPAYCDDQPSPRKVWGDSESGAILVEYDYQSGACLCYPPTMFGALMVDTELFDIIASRPILH